MGIGLTMSKPQHRTNDKYRYCYNGWYYGDLEAEIVYWKHALRDPVEYDTTEEYSQEQIDLYSKLKEEFEAAFEAQRTDKVDYEDGTWV